MVFHADLNSHTVSALSIAVERTAVRAQLDGGSRGPLAGSLVSGSILLGRDVEQFGQRGSVGVGQTDVCALDAAQAGGRDARLGRELRLRHAFDHAPVAGVAVLNGHLHDAVDWRLEDLHDLGEQIDLGRVSAGFPGMDRRLADVGHACQVLNTQALTLSGCGEVGGTPSAQDSPAHAAFSVLMVKQVHRGLRYCVNAVVLYSCRSLEYGEVESAIAEEIPMRIRRSTHSAVTPALPHVAGMQPCFEPIPFAADMPRAVRPLYWWVHDLHQRGYRLLAAQFDTVTAGSTLQLPSYRVLDSQRPAYGPRRGPLTIADELAEAIWKLGITGWADELADMTALLRSAGLLADPEPLQLYTAQINGMPAEPIVRTAYWWAVILMGHGWRLHILDTDEAAGGFFAEIPADSGSDIVLYPAGMRDDRTAASALANFLPQLSAGQRENLSWLINAAMTDKGRVV